LVLAAICAVALLVAFGAGEFLSNQSPDLATYTAKAQEMYKDARSFVEKTRGVTLPDVPLVVITKAWAQQTWGGSGSGQNLKNTLRDENFYKGVFLMHEEESLVQAQTEWTGYWVAVTWNNQIYVVREYFNPFQATSEGTLVHELTHIMQGTLDSPANAYTFDGVEARAALNEGDATFMADFFLNNSLPPTYTPVKDTDQKVNSLPVEASCPGGVFASIPQSISRIDYFAYDYGKRFVSALYAKGGWTEVNAAYANPPTTTAQILDTEEYYQNTTAQSVSSLPLPGQDWTHVRNNQYGEYFIFNLLSTWLPKDQAAASTAEWRGDNFTYYEKGNEYLFTWNIVWQSQSIASSFSGSFQNMAAAVGASKNSNGDWYANGRFLSISQGDNNSTRIACSNNETALQELA
jgi:hypothetical protein